MPRPRGVGVSVGVLGHLFGAESIAGSKNERRLRHHGERLGHVTRREGVVAGDHHDLVRRSLDGGHRGHRVRTQRTADDEETCERQLALGFVTSHGMHLRRVGSVDVLVRERKHARALPRVLPVRLLVIGGDTGEHALDRLRRPLHRHNVAVLRGHAGSLRHLERGHNTHALERAREVEAVEDFDALPLAFLRHGHVTLRDAPVDARKRHLFHRIAAHGLINHGEGVARRDHMRDGVRGRVQFDQAVAPRYSRNAVHNKVVARQCASLVKAAHVNLPGERNAEGLRAKNGETRERNEALVDGERQFPHVLCVDT
eukprot:Opistho-1_new@108530